MHLNFMYWAHCACSHIFRNSNRTVTTDWCVASNYVSAFHHSRPVIHTQGMHSTPSSPSKSTSTTVMKQPWELTYKIWKRHLDCGSVSLLLRNAKASLWIVINVVTGWHRLQSKKEKKWNLVATPTHSVGETFEEAGNGTPWVVLSKVDPNSSDLRRLHDHFSYKPSYC